MRRLLAVCGVIASAGCLGTRFVPPVGPALAAPEAADAWAEATATCRGARTYSAMLHLGSVGANLQTSVTSDGQVFLGAIVAGRPRFTLAGTADQATLVLHDDNRVVRAGAGAIVEALIGTAIGPDVWLAFVTGCVTPSHDIQEAARVGKFIRIVTREGRAYLQRSAGVWRVRGGEVNGLIVDYDWRDSRFPIVLAARSADGQPVETSLRLEAAQFEVNRTIDPVAFAPPRAALTARPMTLAELREAGPLNRKQP